YSTCTIDPDENETIVDEFLKKHSGFSIVDIAKIAPAQFLWNRNTLRTFPHQHGIDGSYAVLIQKK
ncbi:MAG: 16S rRNA (cytosine(967)-C(5))-methyltransferase RsmB, partial [Calditrichota bacterium]